MFVAPLFWRQKSLHILFILRITLYILYIFIYYYGIVVISPYQFTIGDTSTLSDYEGGGIASELKLPKKVSFVSVLCDIIVQD